MSQRKMKTEPEGPDCSRILENGPEEKQDGKGGGPDNKV